VQETELTGHHGLPRSAIALVEAPLEPDMDADALLLDEVHELHRLLQRPGDRLLAEGRQARGDPAPQRGRVGVRGSRDHQSVDAVEKRIEVGGELVARLGGDALGSIREGVRHHHLLHLLERGQGACVEGADPPDADQSDSHGCLPVCASPDSLRARGVGHQDACPRRRQSRVCPDILT